MGWEGPVTYRQYLAWNRWESDEYDRPDRHDFYLAQIACEVRRGWVKSPGSVSIGKMLLEFRPKKPKVIMDPKLATVFSKAKWLGMMTKPVTHKTVDGSVSSPTSGTKPPPPGETYGEILPAHLL